MIPNPAALLDGQVAVITGGSRGIGRAIAEAFLAAGARVMITSRKAETLEAVCRELAGPPRAAGDISWFATNAGDPDGAAACVTATLDRFGALDILVNNAATNPYFGPVIQIDGARAVKTVQVNQLGPLTWAQQAWQAWMAEHGGSIVNVASVGGIAVEPNIGFYNMTKAALIYMTRQLAGELAPRVRVNAIAPGLIRTDMARALLETEEGKSASRIPLGRVGEPADIAQAALYLTSPLASYVTGHTLVVDGGATVAEAAKGKVPNLKEEQA